MISTSSLRPFRPNPPDAAGVISWVHIGDLHMTLAGERNHLDLLRIVAELNEAFADSVAFVFLPGDVADHGSIPEYEVVREALDQLHAPWCSIVGDHDVHEKSFTNFREFMSAQTHFQFNVGEVCFFALNAFDIPDPGSFLLSSEQLSWLEQGLDALKEGQTAVLLLHCYPTDLKQGGGVLRTLVEKHNVRLIEMGHTHYNEVANDGRTLYIATRSTGQIEEGPAGYSITTIDGPVISWRFLPLDTLPAVIITSPSDERFITEGNAATLVVQGKLRVRAKAWARGSIRSVTAKLGDHVLELQPVSGSNVWEGELSETSLPASVYTLSVEATDDSGARAVDKIRIVLGGDAYQPPQRFDRDQDNALAAWPERGLLGTQLGPNKHGKKW